jgi:putative transposase
VPLAPSPYVKCAGDASKGVLARKTKRGRWRFEVVEKREWEVPEALPEMPRLGVDVGLNVMVATSDGRLLGSKLKPKFSSLHSRVKAVRANRQRQGLGNNSPRLDRLESKLTGMVKTMAGECANKLVTSYPGYVFVIEDLDLRGCRGQKRFAYRALHHSLETKAPTQTVNPAYSSQTCPSCGYVSRSNRVSIRFHCRACGRKSHADVVGGIGLLGRSEDKQIGLDDHPSVVKALLRRRFVERRRSPVERPGVSALEPSSRRFTTRGSPSRDTGTASNQVAHAS